MSAAREAGGALSAVVLLRIGVRLFQTGSISHGSRATVRQALRSAR